MSNTKHSISGSPSLFLISRRSRFLQILHLMPRNVTLERKSHMANALSRDFHRERISKGDNLGRMDRVSRRMKLAHREIGWLLNCCLRRSDWQI